MPYASFRLITCKYFSFMIIPYISLFLDSLVLCIFLRTYNRSPDINDVSDVATNLESPFEQNMCLEGSQDFEDDGDCNLSPDLLRMVEHEEKQILPHKETVEVVNLGDELEKKSKDRSLHYHRDKVGPY